MSDTSGSWYEANQAYLVAVIESVRAALERHAARGAGEEVEGVEPPRLPPPPDGLEPPPAMATLAATLGLSAFEQRLLALCAGVELEGDFPALCARAQGDAAKPYPTFGLALAALPGANWAAIAGGGPLRFWQLVEVGPGGAMTTSQLRIDEPILHYLTGVSSPDERLAGLSDEVEVPPELAPSHREQARELATIWGRTAGSRELPALQLCGRAGAGKRVLAAAVARSLGLGLLRAPAAVLPTTPAELLKLTRLWNRHALLFSSALLLDCDEVEPGDALRDTAIRQVVAGYRGPLFLTSRRRRPDLERSTVAVDVAKPLRAEQLAIWRRLLGDAAAELDGNLDRLVAQFDLDEPGIHAAHAGALGRLARRSEEDGGDSAALAGTLWWSCRTQSRPQLEGLADRIRGGAGWEELVLPQDRLQALREIVFHVRHRVQVYEDWGFAARSSRGLGISALFAGASGTGKTMAAEVLASELQLDLYRIDLSSVVSKYIGETEKNLARIFDAAETGGAILLFDEADALFGKRTEIRDSHDRYANVEVSYLLQRMESYQGLAILTTNMRDALDVAFLRRLRFVVEFPFPGPEERAEIWRRIFPPDAPTAKLAIDKLARLNVTGGNIRNIAMQAAFLAAGEDRPVTMRHLKTAARSEFQKMDKALPERAVGDWS